MGFFKKLFGKKLDGLYAPMAGKAVPVTEVPDPTFAEGMLGNGVAVIPTDGKVYAPCDATVDMMFETGHAVSLVADCGAELLIHIGLETVALQAVKRINRGARRINPLALTKVAICARFIVCV